MRRSWSLSRVISYHHCPALWAWNPKKRRKSWTIVVWIGEASWRDVCKKEEGRTPNRASCERACRWGRGELVEGGIYEIAGHLPSSGGMVNPGDRWAAALMYVRVHGVEKSEPLSFRIYRERARVCVVPGHAGFRKGRKAGGQNPWKAETSTPLAVDRAPRPPARPIPPRADNGGGSSLRLPPPQDATVSRTISKRRMYVCTYIYVYRRLYRIRFATARLHRIRPSSFSRPRKFSGLRPTRSPARDAEDRSPVRFPTFVFDISGEYLGGIAHAANGNWKIRTNEFIRVEKI